jgi:3-oxoacyl-[acyl-carrier-protein] synthase-3
MNQVFENINIKAISSCVPPRVVKNEEFSILLNPKEMSSFEKTVGIFERRWASDDVTASDLGFKAAQAIFDQDISLSKNVKALIFLSQTSDYKIPFTSNILQFKLGLDQDTLCLDINAGCTGFVQGLSVAFSIANTFDDDELVLLIVSETLSKILAPSDRSTTMLFGDAGSAIIIGKSKTAGKSYFNTFSDGGNFESIIIRDGGFRNIITEKSFSLENKMSNLNLSMDGPKVFDFTLREIVPSILKLISDNSINVDSIDYFLLHQSNRFIIKQIIGKLGIATDKTLINIEKFGNTSGVSIPLLINTFKDKLNNSKQVMFTGYGSGLNWGNCLTDLSETKKFNIIEY